MKVRIAEGDPVAIETSALVVGCLEEQGNPGILADLDRLLGGVITALYEAKEFTGKLNKVKILHTLGKIPAQRILLVGLGQRTDLDTERIRQACGTAAQALKAIGASNCVLIMSELPSNPLQAIRGSLEGILLGSYSFGQYRTKPDELKPLDEVMLPVGTAGVSGDIDRICAEAVAIADAVRFTRDMVSQPGNVATPAFIAEQASLMAGRFGVKCRILGRDGIEQEKMNGLLSVGKGSEQEPRFIILEYEGGVRSGKPLVLVGKGITFDSGGISLKPRDGMERMKDDMAGAAAVVGAIQAAAALSIQVNLVGLIPAAENMPDGKSYKPGDVITTMSGKTVEINNTDAEGRMVLCDALHYAQRYKPRAVVDLATLTGACVVALGTHASGMIGNDDGLKRALVSAGMVTGERVWELPVWDDYGEAMKSDIADMKNSGGAHGGAITAGWFLKQFVGDTRWVHLDIAGTAWEEKGKHYLPKGATGVGVRLLVEYMQGLK